MTMTTNRAANYARFSNEKLQKLSSIKDQFALADDIAKREGLNIVRRFRDEGKSGRTEFGRDGFAALKEAVKRREFDCIIVEDINRLARDTADMARFWKRTLHSGIDIYDAKGKVTKADVAVKGLMAQLFGDALAVAVKRSHNGLIRDGLIPGRCAYGYKKVELAPNIFDPGKREIDDERAKIVVRIFTEYFERKSCRTIAARLTSEGIKSPSGRASWSHIAVRDILNNRLYAGELAWNRRHVVEDPDTYVRSKRPSPKDELKTTEVPHLQIIKPALWEATQSLRNDRANKKGWSATTRSTVTRSDHLLSGLLRCGVCHGNMIIANGCHGKRYVKCSAAQLRSACTHRKGYNIDALQSLVIENFRSNMIDPARMKKMAAEHHARFTERSKRDGSDKIEAIKELGKVKLTIERIVATIIDVGNSPAMSQKLKEQEARQAHLDERVRLLSSSSVVAMHPTIMTRYMAVIDDLAEALKDPSADNVKATFKNFMDGIVVHPATDTEGYSIEAFARAAAMMGFNPFPATRSVEEIITAEGFNEFEISEGQTSLTQLYLTNKQGLISLGRWRAAA